MKILMVNKFLYPRGGDAIATLKTGSLLAAKGHDVIYWGMSHELNPEYPYSGLFVSNVDFDSGMSFAQKIGAAFRILYSFEARDKVRKLLEKVKPDIVHLNNFAHQISPSILGIFRENKIPAVMTMHDYKLVCPAYSSWLNGKFCSLCSGGRYYRCFLNRCTKGSGFKSAVNMAEMYLHHNVLHLYGKIDVYISPSAFMRDRIKESGFKGEIIHLPNFVDTKAYAPSYAFEEKSMVYVGRLSAEKGMNTLLDAFRGTDIKLKIIGTGELEEHLKNRIRNENLANINLLGYKSGGELKDEIMRSAAVVLPSECNENNPLTVLEAFAMGKPVIGSRTGGIPELVKDGETGFTFTCGNAGDLRQKAEDLISDAAGISRMGRNARAFAEKNNSPEVYYVRLMEIYGMASRKEERGAN